MLGIDSDKIGQNSEIIFFFILEKRLNKEREEERN